MNSIPDEESSIKQSVGITMELHNEVSIIYLKNGQILHFIGYIHYWNEETDEIRVMNQFNDFICIKISEVVLLYAGGAEMS